MPLILWAFKNPLLSGAGILVITMAATLGIQTMRLGWANNKNEALMLRLGQYQSALAELEKTSALREAAITEDSIAVNIRNATLAEKIEEIERGEDETAPDIILNAIDGL